MKKFWQSSGFQSSNLLDTVSGIVKQNATKLTTVSTNSVDQKQYLRLPLESARRLRWFDSQDLNQIVRSHIREKQELIEFNDLLRKILVDKKMVSEEIIDGALIRRMAEIDNSQVVNESVASALLISVQSELENLKEKLKTESTQFIKESLPEVVDQQDSIFVSFSVNEEADSPILVEFCKSKVPCDTSSALMESLKDLKASLNEADPLFIKVKTTIAALEEESHLTELDHVQRENKQLQEVITVMKQRERKAPLPSEMVTRAQNMCLEAEEETRAAQRQTETAILQASKAEEREKTAIKESHEASRKLTLALDQIKKLKSTHKTAIEEANNDYQTKAKECETLIQRNISLRNEMDELNLKLTHFDKIVTEKDAFAAKVLNLEDGFTELRVRANRGDHYKQIANEMEERVVKMEQELLTTVQKINTLEKKLQTTEKELTKEQTKSEKFETKLRKLKLQESNTELNSSSAMETMKEALLTELEEQKNFLAESKEQERSLEQKLESEHGEKLKLLNDLSEMEDRFLSLEKNHTSTSIHLKHQLSVTKNDLEDCKKYVSQLETERQTLCKKLHVKPDPRIGFEDSKGGGTFRGVSSMSDASNRNGLSAIDTLYLKNVLFKFIEATAKQKTAERDMLLPPVATLLGASREEFNQLKKALEDAGKDTRGMFSLWSTK